MKTLTLFTTVFLIASYVAAQDNNLHFDPMSKVYNGINEKGAHSLFIDYGYETYTDENDSRIFQWGYNSIGLGYLFSVSRNINLGLYGLFTSGVTDNATWSELDINGNRQHYTYYYSTSGSAILFRSQFFWFNRSPCLGLYSGLDFGLWHLKPTAPHLVSGNIQPPPYYGSLSGEQAGGQLILIGAKFRFGRNSHWYFYSEFALITKVIGGMGYRF